MDQDMLASTRRERQGIGHSWVNAMGVGGTGGNRVYDGISGINESGEVEAARGMGFNELRGSNRGQVVTCFQGQRSMCL